MKIGIDASRLTIDKRTGTENYLYYLVIEWAKSNTIDDFILYFREKPGKKLWQELSLGNENFSYKVIPSKYSWTQVGLAMEIFKNTPDILFCPWHTMPGINPFWKMKTVATVHDLTGRFIPTFWTAHFADKVIAVSDYVKDKLISDYKVSAHKISVVYEGYDKKIQKAHKKDITRVKKKYGIEGDYIFFLGTLGPRKNIERMVEAYLELNTEVEYVFGGKVMKGYEDVLELPFKYIGPPPNEDLPELYSGALFTTLVSKEEGFGIPILESMSCETPVLTSNISATGEVAGDAAVLADPFSAEDIKKGMQKLLHDEKLRKRLAKKGKEQVKKFSWKRSASKIMKIFMEAGFELKRNGRKKGSKK
jgi:glycosyltransferase involved in cell wall biosynthesis